MTLSFKPKSPSPAAVSSKNKSPSSSDGIEYHEVYAGSSYSTAQKLGFSLEKGAKAGADAIKKVSKKIADWLGLSELAHEIAFVLQLVGGVGLYCIGLFLVWAFAHPSSVGKAALLLV